MGRGLSLPSQVATVETGGLTAAEVLRRTILLALLTVLIGACTDVPREAVVLSTRIEQDIVELHRANRALAERYFARSKADVERFIEQEYRPFIVSDTMRRLDLLRRLQTAESDEKAFGFMQIFVRQTLTRIEQTRRELLIPLEKQEREVLQSIDDAYAGVINAQSVVTGYLGSAQSVQLAQDEFLERAGLGNLRERLIDRTVGLSDRIADITTKANRGEEKVESALSKLKDILGADG